MTFAITNHSTMKSNLNAVLKKMGYQSDSRGIIDRYIQVAGAWDEHLMKTRQFIIRVLSGRNIQNLAVYGSGWLLDFPLEEASQMARHIWLYDVVHPAQILHKLRKYSNITTVTTDLTGDGLTGAYEAARLFKKQGIKTEPEKLVKHNFIPRITPDYSVSLNILSQVGDIVSEFLERHINYTEDEARRLVAILQQAHLNLLPRGKSCLITDIGEMLFDEQELLKETNDLIRCSLPVSDNTTAWEWQFDPLGEYHSGMTTVSKVIAIEI